MQVSLSSIWQFVASPYIQAVQKATKLQEKNSSFKSALLIPTVSASKCFSFNYSCFLITIFPPVALLHFLYINPPTTHNSSICSDEHHEPADMVLQKSNHTAGKLFLRELTKRKHLEQIQPPPSKKKKKKNTHLLTSQSSPSSTATQPIQDPK